MTQRSTAQTISPLRLVREARELLATVANHPAMLRRGEVIAKVERRLELVERGLRTRST